jgi:UDP-arabinose 4-epimerase
MNVLVTGGAGYVGAHVCKNLARHGFRPVTLDTLERGSKERVQWGPLIPADCGDVEAVSSALREYRCLAVIHCAAYAFVGESVEHPARYYKNNLINTVNLISASIGAGAPAFIFASSCAVYGSKGSERISEDAVPVPINPYAVTKLVGEWELHRLCKAKNVTHAALRLFNVVGCDPALRIGESEYIDYGRLVPDILSAIRGGREVVLNGNAYATLDGTPIRDYIHVEDVAEGFVSCLKRLIDGGGDLCCNLGSGIGASVKEVLAICEHVSGRKANVRWRGARAGDGERLVADVTRSNERLGWHAKYDLRHAIEHAWRFMNRPDGLGKDIGAR